MNAARTAYAQNSIDTATGGQLIIMLYDGLLTALDKAERALGMDPKDIGVVHHELTRSQAIIEELMSSLNPSAGDIATSLASLYEYCHRQLVDANMTKDFGPAQVVRSIFTDLKGAWATVAGIAEGAA
jgi:flagellar protein FliS